MMPSYSPPDWLTQWLDHIPLGRCLDLGAGEGQLSRWLVDKGFQVTAVEHDPALAEHIRQLASSNISVMEVDLARYQPEPQTFSLVVAAAVLHFLHPHELTKVADRLMWAMKPGALLMAEVLTVDDPSYQVRRETQPMVEADTFELEDRPGLIHYFRSRQLLKLFERLHPLDYHEDRRSDPEAQAGYRAGASLVARRLDG